RLVDMDRQTGGALRDAFHQGFGPEPPHRPVSDRVEAGHRAVRRRRLTGTVLTVAVATAVGLGSLAVLDGRATSPDVAADPTTSATPTSTPWDADVPARYAEDGTLEIQPGATVVQRIDDPVGDPSADHHSVALSLQAADGPVWLILDWRRVTDGPPVLGVVPGAPTDGLFADWVSDVITPGRHYLAFAEDGRLVSVPGVTILDQRHPIDLKDFTLGGEPSAAALVQDLTGERWYVVARLVDGGVDIFRVSLQEGGPDLDAFLLYATRRYASGEGLL
ncbi:MAG: hypothetical protein ABIO16_15400, partial [Nocardioides sp.]